MDAKKIIRFLTKKRESGVSHPKVSADEVELKSYQEEERRDKIKELLGHYRKKKSSEMLIGNTFAEQSKKIYGDHSILGAKNIFNDKNCFGGKNKILR